MENPNLFKIKCLRPKTTQNSEVDKIRLTLDTDEDYALLCTIYDYLYKSNPFSQYLHCLSGSLFHDHLQIIQKKIFNSEAKETIEAIKLLELYELDYAKKLLEKHLVQ